MRVYVADLARYNEGDLVGKWFDLPLEMDVMDALREAMDYNPEQHDHALHDWEDIPFPISEYTSLHTANEMAERIAHFDETEREVLQVIIDMGIADFDRAVEMVENGEYRIYWNCESMGEVAEQYLDEAGYFNEIPASIRDQIMYYFDYEAYGRDMENNGTWKRCRDENGTCYYIEILE